MALSSKNVSLSIYFNSLPRKLVIKLESEFQKLHMQYFCGKWEPAQLDGGRFGELVLRIIEYKNTGNYTSLDSDLDRMRIVTQVAQNTTLARSIRLQIPTLAGLIIDFRNGRNVAHIGTIDVSEMDSTFVLNAANWIIAELIRIESRISPGEAQKQINKVIERKIPLVEEFNGRLKILNPKLTKKEMILICCFQKYPEYVLGEELRLWVGEKNKSRFQHYLIEMNKDKVDYYAGQVKLTKIGLVWVEKNINFELKI